MAGGPIGEDDLRGHDPVGHAPERPVSERGSDRRLAGVADVCAEPLLDCAACRRLPSGARAARLGAMERPAAATVDTLRDEGILSRAELEVIGSSSDLT